uniref:Uncharacterized protein n=1 Tax=Clandestinovirus TaxID=2831644 RepID=A0A8F8KQY6_9VIRU|nr:hypothetical protein KOM_12_122 [Clandestinovirus]
MSINPCASAPFFPNVFMIYRINRDPEPFLPKAYLSRHAIRMESENDYKNQYADKKEWMLFPLFSKDDEANERYVFAPQSLMANEIPDSRFTNSATCFDHWSQKVGTSFVTAKLRHEIVWVRKDGVVLDRVSSLDALYFRDNVYKQLRMIINKVSFIPTEIIRMIASKMTFSIYTNSIHQTKILSNICRSMVQYKH